MPHPNLLLIENKLEFIVLFYDQYAMIYVDGPWIVKGLSRHGFMIETCNWIIATDGNISLLSYVCAVIE